MIITDYSIITKKAQLEEARRRRNQCREDMKEARSQGDLRENFGYQESRRELQLLTNALEDLETDLKTMLTHPTTDPMDWTEETEKPQCAAVGVLVTYSHQNGEEHTILIGGAWDDHNPEKVIPYSSPLGAALVCTEKGKKTTLQLSKGETDTLKVLKLEIPSKEYIMEAYPAR